MGRVKDQVEQIIGKRISGVVIKETKAPGGSPTNQLFLLFDDGSYYEFYTYGCDIGTTAGVVQGGYDSVVSYMSDTLEPVYVKCRE